MVREVFQRRQKLGVELFQRIELVDVQIQKMTKHMMVVFELEYIEPVVQGIHHFFRGHGRRWEWRSDFEDFEFYVVRYAKEEVHLYVSIFLDPCSTLLQQSRLRLRVAFGCGVVD